MTFPKFIIETDEILGDCLILDEVTFHKHIATNKEQVKGGGWYRINLAERTLTFYGKSEDFGPASLEDIKACVNTGKVFMNKNLHHIIKFQYDTQTEIIELNWNDPKKFLTHPFFIQPN